MFCVQYQWKIISGREAEFEEVWCKITKEAKNNHSMHGAKLFQLPDGSYMAHAEWTSENAWEQSHQNFPVSEALKERLAQTVESTEGLLCMQVKHDYF